MKLPKTQEKKVLWGIRIGQDTAEGIEYSDTIYRFGVFNENVALNAESISEEGNSEPLRAIPTETIDKLFTNKEQGGK